MGITETTQVVFSLGQFSSIISIVVLQTAFMVGIYWKMNKKIDDIDKKVDTNKDQIDDKIKTILSNASNQYLIVEKTFDNQEKSFLTKCESMEKQSQIRYETFSETLRKTNEALDKVNKTTTELYTLILKVKSDFGEHKAFHLGKESKEIEQ